MNEKLIEKLVDMASALANEKSFPQSEANEFIAEPEQKEVDAVWVVGQAYWVQAATITFTGRLTTVTEQELVFDGAAWMSDMGNFSECLKNGTPEKVQPFHGPVILTRGSSVIAVVWNHELPQ